MRGIRSGTSREVRRCVLLVLELETHAYEGEGGQFVRKDVVGLGVKRFTLCDSSFRRTEVRSYKNKGQERRMA